MKKILVILDGMGDVGYDNFGGKSPLEYANTPNLDDLAKKSKQGFMYSVNEDYAPESDTAVIAILGNDPDISARAEFEAAGEGIETKRGDLVLRTNFSTIDNLDTRRVIDRRAGRTLTTDGAVELAKAINEQVKLPVKFKFFPTVQHRGILVFYGGFSDNITNTDTYIHDKGKIFMKDKFDWSKPLDEEENSEYAANQINSFTSQCYEVLSKHPRNLDRVKKGLMPANILLVRDPGVEMPNLRKYRGAMAIVNMPLENGIAKVSNMDIYQMPYPKMKSHDVYANLEDSLTKMCEFAVKTFKKEGKNYHFAYLHIKETDVPGHDNKPLEKKLFFEILDKKLFSFLREYCEKNKIKLIVTADHSTPCKYKTHTSEPVPVMLYDPDEKADGMVFGESNSLKGSLGKLYGKNLLRKVEFIS
jgi:2,3-bisphosphoglycerate-independent phosphoglycerate mutase